MKKVLLALATALALFLLGSAFAGTIKIPTFQENLINDKKSVVEEIFNMKLTSSSFEQNQLIPSKYTCDGENISPPLTISEVPDGTQSLALIVDDPDAPSGVFVHWVVWNIEPSAGEIEEGKLPTGGVQGINDFGEKQYGGPCPPSGTHRYFFKLYALTHPLDLPQGSTKKDLEKAMQGKIIEETQLVGRYSRG